MMPCIGLWLTTHLKNIIIDISRLQALPDNGTIHNAKKIELCKKDYKHDPDLDDSEDNHNFHYDIDREPIDPKTDDLVCDEETEMSSFLSVNENHLKEKDIIKNELFRQDVKHEWKVGHSPLNEFKTDFLATMSFPTLFPDGKGDPTNYSTVRNISDSDTEAFALKLKHLISFGERINGKWVLKFASHPSLPIGLTTFYTENVFYGNFFVKQNRGEANLTTSHLQELWHSNSSLMEKLMHYAKNITGTNAYWVRIKEDLKTTIKQVGAPTIFFTLSCADFHWPEFHSMFSEDFAFTGSAELRGNVTNNPHILDWIFTKRTESFVKWSFLTWYIYPFFQD